MQLQSLTVSRLRRTTGRGLRAFADALRNQVRHQERPRPQREQAFPGSRGDGMPGTTGTTVAPPGQRQASEDTAGAINRWQGSGQAGHAGGSAR